jgi:hypothetical protein
MASKLPTSPKAAVVMDPVAQLLEVFSNSFLLAHIHKGKEADTNTKFLSAVQNFISTRDTVDASKDAQASIFYKRATETFG